MSSASALAPGASCARHPARSATGLCSRCGDYLCGGCGQRVDSRLYCAPCAERMVGQHGPRAAQAFVLGVASVHLLFFLSPVALWLGALELSAIAQGQAPRGGRGLALAGVAFGVAGLLMAATVGAALLLWWEHR